jgi:predicted nucleic acid-binding protein
MNFLLDTNVVSELTKQQINPNVEAWLSKHPSSSYYLSVITLGELTSGVERLVEGKKKAALSHWLNTELLHFFSGRLLTVSYEVSQTWGRLLASKARPGSEIDGLLAATAITYDLILVTRNTKDFPYKDLRLHNPW